MKFDPFLSDLIMGSSKWGRIFAAFITTLKFDVSSTNDNSCWFGNPMNWKPGLFLLRTMKRGFQSTTFLYISFMLISSSWSIKFQGSKGTVVIAEGDGLDCVAFGSTFVSGVAGDVSFELG